MKNYVKVDGYWVEYDPADSNALMSIYKDIFGDKEKFDILKLELSQAEKEDDLNWENTNICNKINRTGWLSPNGEFFGCEPWFHAKQANLIHKKDERDLEREGWVKIIYADSLKDEKVLKVEFYSDDDMVYPTKEQLNYVFNNYSDNKHLYYALREIAEYRKSLIKEEWGI